MRYSDIAGNTNEGHYCSLRAVFATQTWFESRDVAAEGSWAETRLCFEFLWNLFHLFRNLWTLESGQLLSWCWNFLQKLQKLEGQWCVQCGQSRNDKSGFQVWHVIQKPFNVCMASLHSSHGLPQRLRQPHSSWFPKHRWQLLMSHFLFISWNSWIRLFVVFEGWWHVVRFFVVWGQPDWPGQGFCWFAIFVLPFY